MRRLSSSFLPRACCTGLVLALAAAAGCGRQAPSGSGDAATPAYLNPKLPVAQRVDDLVSRMTLDEKVSQMRDHAPAIPRLGVPKYEWWNEGLHGVAFADDATNFPQVIGMAATWDTDLVHRMGQVVSTEARAKYNQAIRDGPARDVLRPHLLGAEREHLPRPALGPRPGDLRRRPVPQRPHGRRLRHGHAG